LEIGFLELCVERFQNLIVLALVFRNALELLPA
jgi:hypothetical protein